MVLTAPFQDQMARVMAYQTTDRALPAVVLPHPMQNIGPDEIEDRGPAARRSGRAADAHRRRRVTVAPLAILGIGLHLPPPDPILEWAAARGGDVSSYAGWANACHATENDHPSTMGAEALGTALTESGVDAADLRLVVFTGSSRDYVPSWSVASEIMRLNGATERCLGLDLTAGCLATLAGLDLAHGWLSAHGGGHAAIVTAERWSQTIDYADPTTMALWAYGDSGGAVVVGLDVPERPLARFHGAEFTSAADNNGHVLIPYGGTRQPEAPPGGNPFRRRVSDRPKSVISDSYRLAYGRVFGAFRDRFAVEPDHLVCNQMSPALVGMITEAFGRANNTEAFGRANSTEAGPASRVVLTGPQTGHLGGTDILVGLDELSRSGRLDRAPRRVRQHRLRIRRRPRRRRALTGFLSSTCPTLDQPDQEPLWTSRRSSTNAGSGRRASR